MFPSLWLTNTPLPHQPPTSTHNYLERGPLSLCPPSEVREEGVEEGGVREGGWHCTRWLAGTLEEKNSDGAHKRLKVPDTLVFEQAMLCHTSDCLLILDPVEDWGADNIKKIYWVEENKSYSLPTQLLTIHKRGYLIQKITKNMHNYDWPLHEDKLRNRRKEVLLPLTSQHCHYSHWTWWRRSAWELLGVFSCHLQSCYFSADPQHPACCSRHLPDSPVEVTLNMNHPILKHWCQPYRD